MTDLKRVRRGDLQAPIDEVSIAYCLDSSVIKLLVIPLSEVEL